MNRWIRRTLPLPPPFLIAASLLVSAAANGTAAAGTATPDDAVQGGAAARAAVAPARTPSPRPPLVVDTDMGLDDVRAILALLADPVLDIHGFVTVGGSAAAGKGADNLIGLLETCRIESMAVIVGYDDPSLPAPPWRTTADGLAGAAFPPPRRISPVRGTAAELVRLLGEEPGCDYLALGPLGNLAALDAGWREGIGAIGTIWIPAAVSDGALSGWNLDYDPDASEYVLRSARAIIALDVSAAGSVDARRLLGSLAGPSEAASWIRRLLAGIRDGGGHLMVHDELAAAVLLDGSLAEIGGTRYRAGEFEGGGFPLTPDPGGNIRIARMRDLDAALRLLAEHWERDPAQRAGRPRHMDAHGGALPVRELLRTFHGHLGPYVVIGYRMGRLALGILGSEGHFGIEAEVYSVLAPPKSCLIDGVQLGSGCTLGKRNIAVHALDGPAYASFTAGDSRVTVRLRPETEELVGGLIETFGVEAAGDSLLSIGVDALFTVERGGE